MALGRKSTLNRVLTVDLPMLAILVFTLGPYLWMLLTSLTAESELFTRGPSIFDLVWSNYERLFANVGFARNMLDSFIIAAGTVVVGLTLSVTAAYSFSRFDFRFKKVLLLQFLLINMFPLVLLILPLFVLMRQLGLLDTHFALIVANSTIAIPFSVWMMTSYINGIPKSLDEAAMTDGCSRLQAMRKVILPLCAPGIIATGIYIFITAWIGISLPKLASRALERPEPTDILMRAMFNNRIPGPALPDIFDRQVVNTTQAPVPSLRDMAETCFRRDEAEEIIAEKRELFEYIRDRVGLDFLDGEKRENEMPDEAELLRRMIDYLVEISLDQAVRLKRLERLVNELRTAKGGA